jgi:DNA-binding GntR family transcriptional regulator
VAPVREALHILAGQGVIELLPQRSPRIRKLSGHDIIDILHVWAGLGTVAIRASAEAFARGTNAPDDRADIEEAVRRIRAAERRGNPMDSLGSLLGFHDVLDRISGNKYLPILKGQLHFPHLHRHMAEHWPWLEQGLLSRNMGKVAKYILAGNPVGAERAFLTHNDHSIGKLEQKLGPPEAPAR